MPAEFRSSPKVHVVRIVLTLVGVLISGALLRQALLPDEFGEHGYYRPGAVLEEANREARNRDNESCLDCHPFIRKVHLAGIHKTVSCELCHSAYADHVQDDRVVGVMPVVRGEKIRPLCLSCHTKVVRAMPPETIKVVALPEHLEKKKVRTHHICNQCHHVHAPMKWVQEAREMVGLPPTEEDRDPWMN